jgi:hypothetical protein
MPGGKLNKRLYSVSHFLNLGVLFLYYHGYLPDVLSVYFQLFGVFSCDRQERLQLFFDCHNGSLSLLRPIFNVGDTAFVDLGDTGKGANMFAVLFNRL